MQFPSPGTTLHMRRAQAATEAFAGHKALLEGREQALKAQAAALEEAVASNRELEAQVEACTRMLVSGARGPGLGGETRRGCGSMCCFGGEGGMCAAGQGIAVCTGWCDTPHHLPTATV